MNNAEQVWEDVTRLFLIAFPRDSGHRSPHTNSRLERLRAPLNKDSSRETWIGYPKMPFTITDEQIDRILAGPKQPLACDRTEAEAKIRKLVSEYNAMRNRPTAEARAFATKVDTLASSLARHLETSDCSALIQDHLRGPRGLHRLAQHSRSLVEYFQDAPDLPSFSGPRLA